MARRPDLERFAEEHGIRLGTVADLIRYRMENETTVQRSAESTVTTRHGEFRLVAFEDMLDRTVHFALVHGDPDPDDPVLVRVHLQSTLGDVLGVQGEEPGWPLDSAMRRVAEEGEGIVVILRKPEHPQDLINRVRGHAVRATQEGGEGSRVLRTYGVGAQILKDLGVRRMRVLSAPIRMHGISGFGLEVVEYVDR